MGPRRAAFVMSLLVLAACAAKYVVDFCAVTRGPIRLLSAEVDMLSEESNSQIDFYNELGREFCEWKP